MKNKIAISARIERLGVVLEPDGSIEEAEGILNPACCRSRDGELIIYSRSVQKGNISRVGLITASESNGALVTNRRGFALVPEAPYELRSKEGGQGCEDCRVTFMPALDLFLMAYTAFGNDGPRVAAAISKDGFNWERLGPMTFPRLPGHQLDDKDAAFFPEPVLSPSGELCIALYHRPMVFLPDVSDSVKAALSLPARKRQCMRIAYIPFAAVERDVRNLTRVKQSKVLLPPNPKWGSLKNGAGTPPVRTPFGWMSVMHGVDAVPKDGGKYSMRYSAGLLIHDLERPDRIVYQSDEPLFFPQTPDELTGVVNNVVFPTGIDVLSDTTFDIYYGMADFRIGRVRLTVEAAS